MSDARLRGGLRVALAGATGTLGREVLTVLEERRFPVSELVPFASAHSTGADVEFGDNVIPVQTELPSLRSVDLLIVCTPAEAAMELVRQALRAEVPCIDCSGALAGSEEVPLLVAELSAPGAALGAPAVASPAGPALAWALVLSALDRAAQLHRVVGTVLRSAAMAGGAGIEALSRETIALLSQREPPEPQVFPGQVAFDCVPTVGEQAGVGGGLGGETPPEAALARDLQRLLGRPVPMAATVVQVPTFVGDGSALAVEMVRSLEPGELAGVFEKAPGVELWTRDRVGPTTRDTSGRDVALVSRLRRDPSVENGLLLWVAADPVRLSAANAVKLAEARLRLH